jgi:hypothetical protein
MRTNGRIVIISPSYAHSVSFTVNLWRTCMSSAALNGCNWRNIKWHNWMFVAHSSRLVTHDTSSRVASACCTIQLFSYVIFPSSNGGVSWCPFVIQLADHFNELCDLRSSWRRIFTWSSGLLYHVFMWMTINVSKAYTASTSGWRCFCRENGFSRCC